MVAVGNWPGSLRSDQVVGRSLVAYPEEHQYRVRPCLEVVLEPVSVEAFAREVIFRNKTYPFPGVQQGMRHTRGLGRIDQELRTKSVSENPGDRRAGEIQVGD